MPQFTEMFNPLLQALHELGGSGSIEEIDNKVIEIQNTHLKLLTLFMGKGLQRK